jgi:NADPH2:quinone reductase
VAQAIRTSIVRVQVGQSFPLRDATAAHRELEARRTRGSTLLLPGERE